MSLCIVGTTTSMACSMCSMRRIFDGTMRRRNWEGDLLSPVEAAELGGAAAVECPGIDRRNAADMLAAGLDVRYDAGGGVLDDGSGVDVVGE